MACIYVYIEILKSIVFSNCAKELQRQPSNRDDSKLSVSNSNALNAISDNYPSGHTYV